MLQSDDGAPRADPPVTSHSLARGKIPSTQREKKGKKRKKKKKKIPGNGASPPGSRSCSKMSSGSAAAGAGAAGAVEVPLLTGGRRDGNKKDTAAVRQWNAYAAKYGFPSWDDVDGDCFCSPERVQGLAHYMVHAAVKHNTDTEEKEGLAATTVQSYISNLRAVLRDDCQGLHRVGSRFARVRVVFKLGVLGLADHPCSVPPPTVGTLRCTYCI